MKVLFEHLIYFCYESYKKSSGWEIKDIYEDVWQAFLRGNIISTFDINGNLDGILIYEFREDGVCRIKQIVGKGRKLVRILMDKYPTKTLASSFRHGTERIYNRANLERHI